MLNLHWIYVEEETLALLHNMHMKIYDRVALYRVWKLSRKNQTETGRNCHRKIKLRRGGEREFPNIFVTKKKCLPSSLCCHVHLSNHIPLMMKPTEIYLVSHHCCLHAGWWKCTVPQMEQRSHHHVGIRFP